MSILRRKIMRGIYYAHALRLVSLPGVWQGAVMLLSLVALTNFVSIGNVVSNLLQAPVGHLGVFFYNAVSTTEAWTLLLIGLFIFSLLSFRTSVFSRRHVSLGQVA